MALTITISSNLTAASDLLPVYSDIKINALESGGTIDNYLFDIYVDDATLGSFSLQKNQVNAASLNLSTVLEGIFTTDVSLNSAPYFSNTFALKKINYRVTSRTSALATITTAAGTDFRVYNGVISPDETPIFKDPNSFFPHAGGAYWLRKHNAPINILNYVPANGIADEHWLSSFNGNFGTGVNYTITQLQLKSYRFDGSTTTSTVSVTLTDKSVWSVNVSKTSLNTLFGANSVDANTKYCTIQDADGYLKPARINFLQPNKINNPYKIIYVNSLGAPECVLFDRNDEKSIAIKRSTYGYYEQKVYYTDVDKFYSAYSSLMSQEASKSLADLWISPRVYAENDEFVVPKPVIITNTKVVVANKWNVGKILQYRIDFSQSYKTLVQKT
jgi:hypothetical protein